MESLDFWLDEAAASDYGIRLQGPVSFEAPAPRLKTLSVPGRSGDLHIFEGAWGNIAGKASCFVLSRQAGNALAGVQGFLLGRGGYRRLEVGDDPEFYRLARLTGGAQQALRAALLAPFTLTFDCKPQRFSKAGQRPVAFGPAGAPAGAALGTEGPAGLDSPAGGKVNGPIGAREGPLGGGVLHNPYAFPALPLVQVYGSGPGVLQVGQTVVQLKALDGTLTLDSETQDAYQGTLNKNNTILAPEFPALLPGDNPITWTGGIQRVEVTPRWWTL